MGALQFDHSISVESFRCETLERVFADCFLDSYHTRLVGGAAEPLYVPAETGNQQHLIYYREDYFASALHEIAHWCIAGPERRRLEDFGYWYIPDGRSAEQQRAFEAVEYRPQAMEWHFNKACGRRFRLSADNLNGTCTNSGDFARRVLAQARDWQAGGLPDRASRFCRALSREYGTDPDDFRFGESELA